MTSTHAEAMIRLYNRGHTEHDYFVVGKVIYCSNPKSSSELDVEEPSIDEECMKILKAKGAPFFDSWSSFENQNGPATVALWRKNDQTK